MPTGRIPEPTGLALGPVSPVESVARSGHGSHTRTLRRPRCASEQPQITDRVDHGFAIDTRPFQRDPCRTELHVTGAQRYI